MAGGGPEPSGDRSLLEAGAYWRPERTDVTR